MIFKRGVSPPAHQQSATAVSPKPALWARAMPAQFTDLRHKLSLVRTPPGGVDAASTVSGAAAEARSASEHVDEHDPHQLIDILLGRREDRASMDTVTAAAQTATATLHDMQDRFSASTKEYVDTFRTVMKDPADARSQMIGRLMSKEMGRREPPHMEHHNWHRQHGSK